MNVKRNGKIYLEKSLEKITFGQKLIKVGRCIAFVNLKVLWKLYLNTLKTFWEIRFLCSGNNIIEKNGRIVQLLFFYTMFFVLCQTKQRKYPVKKKLINFVEFTVIKMEYKYRKNKPSTRFFLDLKRVWKKVWQTRSLRGAQYILRFSSGYKMSCIQ